MARRIRPPRRRSSAAAAAVRRRPSWAPTTRTGASAGNRAISSMSKKAPSADARRLYTIRRGVAESRRARRTGPPDQEPEDGGDKRQSDGGAPDPEILVEEIKQHARHI